MFKVFINVFPKSSYIESTKDIINTSLPHPPQSSLKHVSRDVCRLYRTSTYFPNHPTDVIQDDNIRKRPAFNDRYKNPGDKQLYFTKHKSLFPYLPPEKLFQECRMSKQFIIPIYHQKPLNKQKIMFLQNVTKRKDSPNDPILRFLQVVKGSPGSSRNNLLALRLTLQRMKTDPPPQEWNPKYSPTISSPLTPVYPLSSQAKDFNNTS